MTGWSRRLGAALAGLAVVTACSAPAPAPPATGPWTGWPLRGDRAQDTALRQQVLDLPGLRERPDAVHLLWLGSVPADGPGRALAAVAVTRTGPGAAPRAQAPADVRVTAFDGKSWSELRDVGPFDPEDVGIDVAPLVDVGPSATDAYLLRAGVGSATIRRPDGSAAGAQVRDDGILLLPPGPAGCNPTVAVVPGHVLVPGPSAPLRARSDQEDALVSLVGGLICNVTPDATGSRLDLLRAGVSVAGSTGSLPGPVAGTVFRLRIEDVAGTRDTLAIAPPAGPATVGSPVEAADPGDPVAVRFAAPAGSTSLLVSASGPTPVTVPALPVLAGGSGTTLFGSATWPVAVVTRDPSGAPSRALVVR